MIRTEWTLNPLSGPVVGAADCDDAEAAWAALTAAWKGTLGKSWGEHHEAAVRRLQAAARHALATGDRFEHRSPGVVVVLTRTDSQP
jgi:hypothetical protein